MTTKTITLPIHFTFTHSRKPNKTVLVGMNWYRNAHFVVSNQVKKEFHKMVAEKMGDIKFKQIYLEYRVYCARYNVDGHNVRSVIEKFFLDGLVENKNIEDDSLNFVLGDTSYYYLDRENPRIEITIKENQPS